MHNAHLSDKMQHFQLVYVVVHFLDERKQTKLQWVQNPSQRTVDNLNNVRREASRHFRNKKKAYLKAKIEDIETNIRLRI